MEFTDEELQQLQAVEDKPSEYDITWDEYTEWLIENWQILDSFNLKVRNQNANSDTVKWCSAYGLTYCYNGYQLREYANNWLEFEQEDPRWKWEAFQAERGYPNSWASLQDMMKFFKKRGLIDGYVKCETYQQCINALNNGFLIYTWSNRCSRSKTSKAKEFVYDKNWAAHCFAVVKEVDWILYWINSFWETWWDKWYFKIPEENYNDLYSTYAIIDHDDTWKLEDLVFNAQYNKAIALWITNGSRPNDPATRKEVAVMIYRAMKK